MLACDGGDGLGRLDLLSRRVYILLRSCIKMILGQGSWIFGDIPHTVDDFGLRLPLALIKNFLTRLITRSTTSRYLLFNINLSFHPTFWSW